MKIKNTKIAKAVGFLCALGITTSGPVQAMDDWEFSYSGYARAYLGMNLEDHAETPSDDQFGLNMARGSLLLDADLTTGPLAWKVITRFDREVGVDYLRELELNTNAVNNIFGTTGTSTRDNYLDQYQTDHIQELFREYYVDFTPIDGVDMRIGKQQLVWGESDFFQAMDLVHGFDLRWRLFFENNEDWRKPLFLINALIDVPKFDGSLNLFVRPGLDREEDIGNNFNIEGGRWIPHPYRGVDFTAFTDYNAEDNDEGDKDDPTYGVRWNSFIGSVGYSVAYLKVFNPAPIMNPAASATVNTFAGLRGIQHGSAPVNQVLGDWTFPLINVFGLSVNGYSAKIDSTWSAEVTFTPDKPFNYGALKSSLPGWAGVKEKDTMAIMLRLDKELKLTNWLGTNRPSLSSIQLFDTWILNHEDSDEIVEFASFGAQKREHTAYLTLFTLLNFKRDTINPSFVIGTDLSNGGGFAIPAVEFVFGDDWRIKAEANLWWSDGDEKKVNGDNRCGVCANPLGTPENSASLFDWFADDNQLVLKVTRQF